MSPTQIVASEYGKMFDPIVLKGMRCHHGMTQTDLAARLNDASYFHYTQNDVSRMERGRITHRPLQRAASNFFRSLGYDADHSGATIYVPPSRP